MPIEMHPGYGTVENAPRKDDRDVGGGGDDDGWASQHKHSTAAVVAGLGLFLWALAIFAGATVRYKNSANPTEQQQRLGRGETGRGPLSPEVTLYEGIMGAPLPIIKKDTKDEAPETGSEKKEDGGRPSWRGEEFWYNGQLVDHLSPNRECANDDENKKDKWSDKKWSQRYFASSEHFRGPGHPIFLIQGGEADAMPGLYYKFISDELAQKFGAYTIQPEHRFYGKSQPMKGEKNPPTTEDLKEVLTVEQVIADNVRLATHIRKKLKCDPDRSSRGYCPLITVGGSYPARIAALMRISHPDVVDMAYAASSPLLGLPGFMDSNSYYNQITRVAERASPGCSAAVKRTLMEVKRALVASSSDDDEEEGSATFANVAGDMGICADTIPKYMTTSALFSEEIMMLAGNIFAEYDMDYYPPNDDTSFVKACRVFQDDGLAAMDKMRSFFLAYAEENDEGSNGGAKDEALKCFDLMTMIPIGGKDGTITSSDWSGAGGGNDGNMWDFQGCYQITTNVGISAESMFPERQWSLKWVTDHCWKRFGIVPELGTLANEYGVNDLVGRGASHILFTNGMNDGWSACGSVLEDLSDTILALNFPNGSHHSDLSYKGPVEGMTDDVREGRIRVAEILGEWLGDIRSDEN